MKLYEFAFGELSFGALFSAMVGLTISGNTMDFDSVGEKRLVGIDGGGALTSLTSGSLQISSSS